MPYIKTNSTGAWKAQSVKYPTLGFGSGHDLMICGIEPMSSSVPNSMEPAWDSLSLPVSLPFSLSLSQINKFYFFF